MTTNSGVGSYSYPAPGQPRPPAKSLLDELRGTLKGQP
jgi:hypothetical protein